VDSHGFGSLAAAIERARRRDYWFSIVVMSAIVAGFVYLIFASGTHLAQNERLLAETFAHADGQAATLMLVIRDTAMWTTLKFAAPLLLFVAPFLFDRYRWRQDKALIELLRAQSKTQAS
jgi:uncharacterized membrane protein YhaH (DUF805 family)